MFDHVDRLGMESLPRSAALVALLAIGSFAGPVQPINAELAVEAKQERSGWIWIEVLSHL